MAEIFEVSQINEYLRQRFEADEFLGSLLIRGELSNYKIYPSGHHYFTLKDSQSAIRCVMFKGSAMRLRFRPETGMKVIAGGRIAVFPRDGSLRYRRSTSICDSALKQTNFSARCSSAVS